MGLRDMRPRWLWLAGALLSCGSDTAACDEADAIAAQIDTQTKRDKISGTGICTRTQADLELELRAVGVTGDVASQAAQYVEACRRLRDVLHRCHR